MNVSTTTVTSQVKDDLRQKYHAKLDVAGMRAATDAIISTATDDCARLHAENIRLHEEIARQRASLDEMARKLEDLINKGIANCDLREISDAAYAGGFGVVPTFLMAEKELLSAADKKQAIERTEEAKKPKSKRKARKA